MASTPSAGAEELRTWLDHVSRPETAKWLMVGIAYHDGVDDDDLADWYGLDPEQYGRFLVEAGETILTDDQVQRMNTRLTGVPVSEELKLVMNVQHLDDFRDLRMPSPMAGSRPAL